MLCPACRTANPDPAKFCLTCGTSLAAPLSIEGERKLATILFADVVGSTGMAERLDPEQVVEILNGAFAFMNAAVVRYEGTVARLMGDAVLAIFGAPVSHEDDAERAVRAGLEISDAAEEYAVTLRARYGIDFQVRVGINTGLVVAGSVGATQGGEYTVMGDTPNLAARLQAAADPGRVLISESTYRLVRHLVDAESRAPLQVKGKSALVQTYDVLGLKPIRAASRGVDGIRSALVGRTAELDLLRKALRAAASGRGRWVAVVGEAGVGKSRLITELRQQSDPGLRWLEGRALSFGESLAYFPWRQLLRQAIGAEDTDAPAAVRARLRAESCTCCRHPERDLALLETLLAVPTEESLRTLTELDGDDLPDHLAEAVRGYLCSIAQRSPAVLVFDDLHWGDSASLELLIRLTDAVRSHPLLLLCVFRPDKAAPSWRMLEQARSALPGQFTEVKLEPLEESYARELLANLLHVEDLPEDIRRTILRKAEGNPFFLEEVLRALIDAGYIVRENHHWRATRDVVNVAIPDTLTSVLSARIDRLPVETKRVAQTAAVLGRIFAQRVLTELCARAPARERVDDVDPHLEMLIYQELVRERARHPELEYIFKHALTQQAAYDLLLVRKRKELHRGAAETLERLFPDRRDEIVPMLAHHFWYAEQWDRALDCALEAGARAAKVYALQEAIAHYERAIQAFGSLPDATPESFVDAVLAWTDIAVKLRIHEQVTPRAEMLDRLGRAERLVRGLDDKRRLAQVLVAKGNVLTLAGFPETAILVVLEAHDLAKELGDEQLFLLPYFLTTMRMVDQDPGRALQQLRRVIELARKHRHKPIEVHALAMKAIAHARRGEFAEAERDIECALEMAPQSNSAIKEADVQIAAGAVYYEMGDVQRGLEHSWEGAQKALAVNGLECACAGYANTGFGNLFADRLREALRAFEESIKLGEASIGLGLQTTLDVFVNQVRAGHAMAEFASGDRAALATLEQRLLNAQNARDDYGAAFIGWSLGRYYVEMGRLGEAEQHLCAALLGYYREAGMRPYVARALRALAMVYSGQGRAGEAEQAHSESERLFAELRYPIADGAAAARPQPELPLQV